MRKILTAAVALLLPNVALSQPALVQTVNPDEIIQTVQDSIKVNAYWNMSTPAGASGTYWMGGFYDWNGAPGEFDAPGVTWGTANSSYAAHMAFVLGVVPTAADTIKVIGTSITDLGVRTTSDTALVVFTAADTVDHYYETPEKWIGAVTLTSTDIAPATDANANYGWTKYWDNNNQDFTVVGVEALWLAGATDSGWTLFFRHHKPNDWVYKALAAPTAPSPVLLKGHTVHSTEFDLVNGEQGSFKRTGLSQAISGSTDEGFLIEVRTTANGALDWLNVQMTYTTQ